MRRAVAVECNVDPGTRSTKALYVALGALPPSDKSSLLHSACPYFAGGPAAYSHGTNSQPHPGRVRPCLFIKLVEAPSLTAAAVSKFAWDCVGESRVLAQSQGLPMMKRGTPNA